MCDHTLTVTVNDQPHRFTLVPKPKGVELRYKPPSDRMTDDGYHLLSVGPEGLCRFLGVNTFGGDNLFPIDTNGMIALNKNEIGTIEHTLVSFYVDDVCIRQTRFYMEGDWQKSIEDYAEEIARNAGKPCSYTTTYTFAGEVTPGGDE